MVVALKSSRIDSQFFLFDEFHPRQMVVMHVVGQGTVHVKNQGFIIRERNHFTAAITFRINSGMVLGSNPAVTMTILCCGKIAI